MSSRISKLAVVAGTFVLLVWPAAAAKKECRYPAAPNASVNVVNQFGDVNVRPAAGSQIVVSANTTSEQVEVDCSQVDGRVEATTHFLQRADSAHGRVDYEISIPPSVSVSVRNASGPIHLNGLNADISLRSDTAAIEVRDLSNAHLRVMTVNGPVTLQNVTGGYVEVLSSGGDVHLNSVSGPKVTVSTTSGSISYAGDFGHGGEYSLTNHTGNIDVALPSSASVDLDARSSHGSVEDSFPLQQKTHLTNTLVAGRSFAGTSNSGSSSVQLRSFSGKIRVKKQ